MGLKTSDKCIAAAFNDERLFVLMTRDITAPTVICEWIKHNLTQQPPEKLHEALDCAIEMNARCLEIKNRRDAGEQPTPIDLSVAGLNELLMYVESKKNHVVSKSDVLHEIQRLIAINKK